MSELRQTAMKIARVAAIALLTVLAGCAAPTVQKGSAADRERVRPEDMLIVDCLLPPQVRQLGQNYTYLAARQPIRTSANDCAVRGGEYVAYDQSTYASALKVWLKQAQSGDPEAQTIVGEVYEEGTATAQADYELAAQWYRKAAEQGYSRAQINLGSLHERGDGVEQDVATAMNWYRRASGLDEAELEITTEQQRIRRRIAAEESHSLRREVIVLKRRLSDASATLQARRSELRKAESELSRLRIEVADSGEGSGDMAAQLNETQKLQDASRADANRLRNQLEAAEAELARVRRRQETSTETLAKAEATQNALRQEVSLAGSGEERSKLEARLAATEKAMVARRAEAVKLRADLAEAQQGFLSLRQKDRALQARLVVRDQEIERLQTELGAAQDELATTRQELANQRNAGSEIARLELQVERGRTEIADFESANAELLAKLGAVDGQLAANAPPQIQILAPDVGLTRGLRRAELFTSAPAYEIVGRVTPATDLSAFRINDESALDAIDDNGLFQLTVPLVTLGETPVSIEAVGSNGRRVEESFTLLRESDPTLAPRQSSTVLRKRMRTDLGKYYALVIGNNNYAGLDNLGTAVNDAETIAEELGLRYGFEVSLLTNATRADIIFELARLTQSLGEYDNLMIYYAGHGVVDDVTGNGYWLGVDAVTSNPETWIGNEQISEFLGAMKAKHVLVVADSCYAGTLSGNAIRPLPLNIEDEDLLFISRVKARTVLTSGGLQPVLDDGGSGHSIFGEAFLEALRGNSDIMEGYRLFDAVRQQVVPRSRLSRVAQDPEYSALQHAGHEGSEFFFLPVG